MFWELTNTNGVVANVGWYQFFDGNGNPYNLCSPSHWEAIDYCFRLVNSAYRPSAWRRTADGFLLVASGYIGPIGTYVGS